jgi:hypothetical protein
MRSRLRELVGFGLNFVQVLIVVYELVQLGLESSIFDGFVNILALQTVDAHQVLLSVSHSLK